MEDLKENTITKLNPIIIDAAGMHYRELNARIKLVISGCKSSKCPHIILNNVLGHRYIGDGIKGEALITVNGTPGNDMAAFMDGPQIEVFGNGQDGIGNTMNSGRIIIHGDCGDILGYSMRGGEIYVEGNVGWRSGIHMKSYLEKFPVIVIGGKAGDFLGEYMAGGIIILLGLDLKKETSVDNPGTKAAVVPANQDQAKQSSANQDQAKQSSANQDQAKQSSANQGQVNHYSPEQHPSMNLCPDEKAGKSYYFERFYPSSDGQAAGNYIGTGMHGGAIFLKGDIEEYKLGKEVSMLPLDENDIQLLKTYITNYCNYFDFDKSKIIGQDLKGFIKLAPFSHRPYGKLYSY
jgi:glutamate synthase domain-containing protein 3